jgi:hypothetical protein
VNKKHSAAPGINWTELVIYTPKIGYKLMTLYWKNYYQLREALVKGKHRDEEKEDYLSLLQ